MELEELSRQLKGEAVMLGLCDKWTNEWGHPDKQGLIDKFKRGMDFVTKYNFPTIDFMKNNFEEELRHKNLIYIDEEISIKNQDGVFIFNGKCSGEIIQDKFGVMRVHVRHDCELTFRCRNMSKVFIVCYDNAKVHIEQSELANVYVYLHDNSSETHIGEIKLRKK